MRGIGALALLASLGACGLQPMYAGGGSGFGGTVGAGSISFDSDNTNLYIRFTAGNALNDLVENAHVTGAFKLDQMTTRPFGNPRLLEAAARLEKQ